MIILASGNITTLDTWNNALRDSKKILVATNFDTLTKMLPNTAQVCVVLDRNIFPGKPIKAVQQIHKLNSQARIVLVSSPEYPRSDQEDLALLKAGIRGFCLTDMDSRMISKVLDAVEQGQIWIQRRLIPPLISELSKQAKGAINIHPKTPNLLS